jgi:hypothetical protein
MSDGGSVGYDLGTLSVPDNGAEPNGRTIGVGFARFRAAKDTEAFPTFHVRGPGHFVPMSLTEDDLCGNRLRTPAGDQTDAR